jgi:DNA repair protein RadC
MSKIKRYKIVPDKDVPSIEKIKISNTEQAAKYVRQFYFEDIDVYESFFLLMLNRGNYTTGWAKISQGGIASALVDVTIVAKFAVENLAKAVILVHNHPSGQLFPSDSDIKTTNQITQGLRLLDISVLDHIILTSDGYYSMLDNGNI